MIVTNTIILLRIVEFRKMMLSAYISMVTLGVRMGAKKEMMGVLAVVQSIKNSTAVSRVSAEVWV